VDIQSKQIIINKRKEDNIITEKQKNRKTNEEKTSKTI